MASNSTTASTSDARVCLAAAPTSQPSKSIDTIRTIDRIRHPVQPQILIDRPASPTQIDRHRGRHRRRLAIHHTTTLIIIIIIIRRRTHGPRPAMIPAEAPAPPTRQRRRRRQMGRCLSASSAAAAASLALCACLLLVRPSGAGAFKCSRPRRPTPPSTPPPRQPPRPTAATPPTPRASHRLWSTPPSDDAGAAAVAAEGDPESFTALYQGQLPPWLLARTEALGFQRPTPVQRAALGPILRVSRSVCHVCVDGAVVGWWVDQSMESPHTPHTHTHTPNPDQYNTGRGRDRPRTDGHGQDAGLPFAVAGGDRPGQARGAGAGGGAEPGVRAAGKDGGGGDRVCVYVQDRVGVE